MFVWRLRCVADSDLSDTVSPCQPGILAHAIGQRHRGKYWAIAVKRRFAPHVASDVLQDYSTSELTEAWLLSWQPCSKHQNAGMTVP